MLCLYWSINKGLRGERTTGVRSKTACILLIMLDEKGMNGHQSDLG